MTIGKIVQAVQFITSNIVHGNFVEQLRTWQLYSILMDKLIS
jgi:hypothetical protein